MPVCMSKVHVTGVYWHFLEKELFYSLNYLPLQIWTTLKICDHDILKTITARSFKLGHLIEDDE